MLRILAFSAIVPLASALFQLTLEFNRDVADIEPLLDQTQESNTKQLASSLWEVSQKDVQLKLNGILLHPDMQYAVVHSKMGDVVATSGTKEENRISRIAPVLYYEH